MNPEQKEKLFYLFNHLYYYTEDLLWKVLEDSEQDPQYSAITTRNLIQCYIDVHSTMGEALPYSTVEEYLDQVLTDEEKTLFKNKYETEIQYYIGKVY